MKKYEWLITGIVTGLFTIAFLQTNQTLLDSYGGLVGVPVICAEYILLAFLLGQVTKRLK